MKINSRLVFVEPYPDTYQEDVKTILSSLGKIPALDVYKRMEREVIDVVGYITEITFAEGADELNMVIESGETTDTIFKRYFTGSGNNIRVYHENGVYLFRYI